MQKDREKNVTWMEPGEILLYELYVREGLKRGRLPYTPNFERIARDYNEEMNISETHHDIWHLLENVLKAGEEKIETFLRRSCVRAPA